MKLLDKIDKIFVFMGMVALFAIMIVIAVDGLGRQLFHVPLAGAYELIEKYLMVAMIFPVIGYTWSVKGHISMTLFLTKMPKAVQNILYICSVVCAFILFAIITYMGWKTTYSAIVSNKLTSGLVRWPQWLSNVWMPLGGFAFCLRMIAELVVSIQKIVKYGINHVIINEPSSEHDGNSD